MPQFLHNLPPENGNDGDEYSPVVFSEWGDEGRQQILLNPCDPKPWLDLATIYFFSMERDKMAGAIGTALLLDPNNAEAWRMLASAYSNAGEARANLVPIKEAIRIAPSDTDG